MEIKIINRSKHITPKYETKNSAGMDIKAFLTSAIILKPLERTLIKTGLFVELPNGYEAQVRPRSGLSLKKGITILNSPGTIDADYRGEIGIILINLSNNNFEINDGDRIAQLVISKYERISWVEVDSLSETSRGSDGFGSTGK